MADTATSIFPIRISADDVGSINTINGLEDACKALIDWPHARRGPFYQAARERIEAALKGEVTEGEAAESFLALCQHAGIVVNDWFVA